MDKDNLTVANREKVYRALARKDAGDVRCEEEAVEVTNQYRFPESLLARTTSLNFTLDYGLLLRREHGGFVIPPYQRGQV